MSESKPTTTAENETNIIKSLNEDNGLAQRVRCGGCSRPIAMTPDKLTEANLVDIKGKNKGDGSQAKGILCNICLKDERVSKEGPRTAIAVNAAGQLSEIYYDNLVDISSSTSTTTTQQTTADTTTATQPQGQGKKVIK